MYERPVVKVVSVAADGTLTSQHANLIGKYAEKYQIGTKTSPPIGFLFGYNPDKVDFLTLAARQDERVLLGLGSLVVARRQLHRALLYELGDNEKSIWYFWNTPGDLSPELLRNIETWHMLDFEPLFDITDDIRAIADWLRAHPTEILPSKGLRDRAIEIETPNHRLIRFIFALYGDTGLL